MKKYSDFPQEIQDKIAQRQVEQSNPVNMDRWIFLNRTNGGFDWRDTPEQAEFWEKVFDENYTEFYEKYPKVEKVGQKFSQDKLPIWTVLFKQFPQSIKEVVKCSQAGHLKYKDHGDEDWMNFSRVPDPEFQYKNAALRHLMETDTFNEDMKEYGEIRHSAQAIWNLLCSLEMEMRSEKFKEDYCQPTGYVPEPDRITYSSPIKDTLTIEVTDTPEVREILNKIVEITDVPTVDFRNPETYDKSYRYEYSDDDGGVNFVWVTEALHNDLKDDPKFKFVCEYPSREVMTECIKDQSNLDKLKKLESSTSNWKEDFERRAEERKTKYKPEEKIPSYYFDRPTLSVDQLLNRGVSQPNKGDYPDFPVDHELG